MSIIHSVELPDGNKYNVSLPFLADGFTTTAGSSTSGAYLATKWAVPSVNGITTPVDGMTIQIRVPLAGTSGGILLSIDGGTTYYPIVRNVNTLVTTTYAVGSTIIVTFNDTQTAKPYLTAGTATTVTGCWQVADYDANTRNSVGDYRKNGTKLYFVGTTSSDASSSSSYATSYTNSNVYVGTDNGLYCYNSDAAAVEKVATKSDLEPLIVTGEIGTTSMEDTTIVGELVNLSHTYSEIRTSFLSGKLVCFLDSSSYYVLTVVTDDYCMFSHVQGDTVAVPLIAVIKINSDNSAFMYGTFIQKKLTFDSSPKSGSTNPVTSGGVYSAIQDASEVFIAIYGTTTNAEIEAAYQAGKTIFCKYVDETDGIDEMAPFTSKIGSTYHMFISVSTAFVCMSNDWSKMYTTDVMNLQTKITGTAGDFVVIGDDGNVTTKSIVPAIIRKW